MIYHAFLELFEPRRRSFIWQLFTFAVRGHDWVREPRYKPSNNVQEVFRRVTAECDDRIVLPWMRGEMKDDCENLKVSLDLPEARQFAAYVIDCERQRPLLQEKLKGDRAVQFQQKAMAAKPASDKQKAYVKALGFAGETEGMSMAEASKLIEKMKA